MRHQHLILVVCLLMRGGRGFLPRASLHVSVGEHTNNCQNKRKIGFWLNPLKTTKIGTTEQEPSFVTSPRPPQQQSQDNNNNNNNTHSLYLFSLPAWNLLETTETSTSAHAAILVRRLWDWKDDVLGDGRDFFVPRPKTLLALNQLFQRQLHAQECVVLSNCARFDVLLVVPDVDSEKDEVTIRQQVAQALLQQYDHYYQARNNGPKFQLGWFDGGDQPKRLYLDPPPLMNASETSSFDQTLNIKTLTNHLQSIQGPATIARYLCRVATGLQAQGRRPDRDVVFRPFSSRDAHVMLQLKRTADIASTKSKGTQSQSQPRIKALLDTALQSGKAARDPARVPAIVPLKKFGSASSSSRYSLGDAPVELTTKAAQQAHELAIEPMVAKYVQKWTALEVSDQIKTFRDTVEVAVHQHLGLNLETSPEAKPIRAMMHPYVMVLREGRAVDVNLLLKEIREFKV